ncbi:6806_t:CDS:2 [Acaulospora morrowiae]|uniref:6806_t:CDS:1 n=1 Tax=Acaulospora morrowiae TaxID=94023 RepID=A0A9N9B5F4_9GLOM|nr:6806_t:CDS:2 [Acaulospora morrowiae]
MHDRLFDLSNHSVTKQLLRTNIWWLIFIMVAFTEANKSLLEGLNLRAKNNYKTVVPLLESASKIKEMSNLEGSSSQVRLEIVDEDDNDSASFNADDNEPPEIEENTKIVCSPNLKYAAAWDYFKDIVCVYSIKGQGDPKYRASFTFDILETLPEPDPELNGYFIDLLDISDKNHVILNASFNDNTETTEELVLVDAKNPQNMKCHLLKTPGDQGKWIERSFITNQNYVEYVIVKRSGDIATGYLFTELDWKCKNIFRVPDFSPYDYLRISADGKLFIYRYDIHILTRWDVKSLKFEKEWALEWSFTSPRGFIVGNQVLNENATFLAIWDNKNIYTCSLEEQRIVASFSPEYDIRECYFLSSNVGVYLFVVCSKNEWSHSYYLLDPYTLGKKIDAKILMESSEGTERKVDPDFVQNEVKRMLEEITEERREREELEREITKQELENTDSENVTVELTEPYMLSNNKYFYVYNNKLCVREFVEKNWANHVGTLNVYPRGEDVKYLLRTTLPKTSSVEGPFIHTDNIMGRWSIKFDSQSIILEAKSDKKTIRGRDIYMIVEDPKKGRNGRKMTRKDSSYREDESKQGLAEYVKSVQVLENEDLLMIATIGIFIWTVKDIKVEDDSEKIRLHYFWSWNLKIDEKDLMERYLPMPDFTFIIENLQKFTNGSGKESPFFKEIIDDYFEDPFKIDLYGKNLLELLFTLEDNELIEKLMDSIIKLTVDNSEGNFVSNIRLLNLIACNFVHLSNQYPNITNRVLSKVAFFVPGDENSFRIVNHYSTSRHHQHLDAYPEISPINILTPIKRVFNYYLYCYKKLRSFLASVFSPDEGKLTIKLVFPFPNFVSYPTEYNTYLELIYPKHSPFTDYDKPHLYKWWNGEALLDFKWNKYGRKYYLSIWAFYTIFMASFTISATLESQLSWNMLKALLISTIVTGMILLLFEIRQFAYDMRRYVASPWNYFGKLKKADVIELKDIIVSLQNNTYGDLNPPYIPERLFKLIHYKDSLENVKLINLLEEIGEIKGLIRSNSKSG